MIRVFVVDDHPALRAGLWTVLRSEPGLEFVGSAASATEALELIRGIRPDVALIDYRLPAGNGIQLCHRLKALPDPPRVLVYSAFVDSSLVIPAAVAGADGVLSKAALPDELLEAIRLVAKGQPVLPPTTSERVRASAARLDPEDVSIFGMLMARTDAAVIADTLGIGEQDLKARIEHILIRLQVDARTV